MIMYASYGVLAHEKQPVYTLDCPASEIYETYELELPEGWKFAEAKLGGTLIISSNETTYLPYEILTNWGDEPALIYFDGNKNRRNMLTDYATKLK